MTRRRKKAEKTAEPAAETDDIDLIAILRFTGIIIAATLLSLLAMKLMFDRLLAGARAHDARPSPLAELAEPRLPPAPRLQTAPDAELGRMRADEERRLRTYGWGDPPAGRVRIPIDRAMDLLTERGWPVSKSSASSDSLGKRGRHAK